MDLKDYFIFEEKRTVILIIISSISLILSFLNIKIGIFDFSWIAIILCGIPIIKDAVIGIVKEFDIKADLLVAIALIASIIIGEIFAAGEIAVIMMIGGFLEEHTVAKSRAGIEKLVHLTPQTARVIKKGTEKIISAKKVAIGDLVKVLPGESIPIDGKLVEGETSIDESIITGEPIPVDKKIGDEVFSGTVNHFGSFLMKARKIGKDSTLSRMIELVKSADADKSKIVRLTDKWATWIVVIALSSAIATYFLTGEIIRSVTILVVFCPCALVLATPTAIMASIGNLTNYGILVKEGDALERLSKVKNVIFDKTGTLTYGKPEIISIIPYKNIEIHNNSYFDEEKLLKITASLENKSEHPLGKAIVNFYKNTIVNENNRKNIHNDKDNSKNDFNSSQNDIKDFFNVFNFQMIIGKGVKGLINKKEVLAGNKELLEENNVKIDLNWKDSLLNPLIEKGFTIIYIAIDDNVKGAIVLGDTLREDAKETISNIKNIGLNTILLTGDNEKPAKHMANQVGINNLYHNCLPETKMGIIDDYQKNKDENVAMIGDGINDAPSLKKSFVGIAMGGIGSDITVDAADIALISDDIKFIPHLLKLSRKTMNTININIILSLSLNFIAIILAILGILNPILGALVHNVGSVLVVIYSSLLLRWKSK